DAALDQLVLEDLDGGLGALLGFRLDGHRVLARPGHGGSGSAEVEPRGQLLGRLVERVVHLLAVDLAHHVERWIRHWKLTPRASCRTAWPHSIALDEPDGGQRRVACLSLPRRALRGKPPGRSEEHTSELQSRENLVCRL